MSELDPEIGYYLCNGLETDPAVLGVGSFVSNIDEEKVDWGSDVFFEALSPLMNAKTGRFDPDRFPEYIEMYQGAVGQLQGFSTQEIEYSHRLGVQCIEDHVRQMRDREAREQFDG